MITIREWIYYNEIRGKSSFSYADIMAANLSVGEQNIQNTLYRLCVQKRIALVHKGFYVIIPPQYALKGVVPVSYYINQLMRYLNKPYYISLLSAGDLHGAAHQRPQQCFVTTRYPVVSTSQNRNNQIIWIYRNDIEESLLEKRNSETETITFSNPELTAVDLVHNQHYIGGLSRASEVLVELCEKTDFSNAAEKLLPYTTLSSVQRLGYILENVICEKEQADILFSQLMSYGKRLNYIPLNHRLGMNVLNTDRRWRIIVNSNIEIDEI